MDVFEMLLQSGDVSLGMASCSLCRYSPVRFVKIVKMKQTLG